MARTRPRQETALITSAGHSHTRDVDRRSRVYFIAMSIRTACFFAFLFLPGWWKVAALIGAAVLPGIAVLLANNADHRPPPGDPGLGDMTRPALPPAETIRGDVEDET